MPLYEIKKLSTWCGDSFHQSYKYCRIGITTSKKLIGELEGIQMSRNEEDWPECCMKDWPIYKCIEIKSLTLKDLKKINDIKIK